MGTLTSNREARLDAENVAMRRAPSPRRIARREALLDDITGLITRGAFFTVAREFERLAWRTEQPLSLVLVDIDGLEWIDLELGERISERAVCDTAELLVATFRSSDVVGRLARDQFGVLMFGEGHESAVNPTLRLRTELDTRNASREHVWPLSLSSGLATSTPERHVSVTDMMRRAGAVMEHEKLAKGQRFAAPA